MDEKQALEMIKELMLEPNNIAKEWLECMKVCKNALIFKMEADKNGNSKGL